MMINTTASSPSGNYIMYDPNTQSFSLWQKPPIGVQNSAHTMKNNNITYFDRLPVEIIGKILKNMSISESLPLAATSHLFLSEAVRNIELATGKDLAEAMFSLVDKGDCQSINLLRLMNINYFLVKEDKTDNNLLHCAVQSQKSDICSILLKIESVDINASNKEGYTPLHYAIKNNDISTLTKLLDMPGIDLNDNCNISDLDDDDQNYLPLLHYAVKCGNFDIVKTLLDHKRINVNVCD
jgi:ankyrin repeat protein